MSPPRWAAAAFSLLLAALLPVVALGFSPTTTAPQVEAYQPPVRSVADDTPPFSRDAVSDDVLWLARCIYSETKRAPEQELVAWVVRNRVETEYRGRSTYEAVVLDPYQFSAFNPGSAKRRLFLSLHPHSDAQGWAQALEVAHTVYHATAADRPFDQKTRHFYSERSMRGGRTPAWAIGKQPVQPVRFRPDPRRFRFYSAIASATVIG
ncbi:MAG: cell wall hydrolase [Bacteroidota bacterium]